MVKRKISFTAEDRKRIEDAVAAVEKKTSGEIVPFVVESSSGYRWVHLLWPMVGWLIASSAILIHAMTSHFPTSVSHSITYQTLVAVVMFAISFIPAVKRASIPAYMKDEKVETKCHATFLRAGLTKTKSRTGVLIFFSLFERRIVIWADEGIFKKVPQEFWKQQVDNLVKGIHEGRAVDLLCEIIHSVGVKLAENFPIDPNDINELSDSLRTE